MASEADEILGRITGDIDKPAPAPISDEAQDILNKTVLPSTELQSQLLQRQIAPRETDIELEPRVPATFQERPLQKTIFGDMNRDMARVMGGERTEEHIQQLQQIYPSHEEIGVTKDEYRKNFIDNVAPSPDEQRILHTLASRHLKQLPGAVLDMEKLNPARFRADMIEEFPEYESILRDTPLNAAERSENDIALKKGSEANLSRETAKLFRETFETDRFRLPFGEDYFNVDLEAFDSQLSDELAGADSSKEFMDIFKELNPNGMIFSVEYPEPTLPYPRDERHAQRNPTGQKILYKKNLFDPDEPFKELRISTMDVLQEMGPELIGAVGAAAVTPQKGLVVQSLMTGLGWIGGSVLDEKVFKNMFKEAAQTEEFREYFVRGMQEGGEVALMNIVFGLAGRAIRGEPLLHQDTVTGSLIREANRLSHLIEKETGGKIKANNALPILFMHGMGDHQMMQAMGKQALNMSKKFQQHYQKLLQNPKMVVQLMKELRLGSGMTSEASRRSFQSLMQTIEANETAKYLKTVQRLRSLPSVKPTGPITDKVAQQKLVQLLDDLTDKMGKAEGAAWGEVDDIVKGRLIGFDVRQLKVLAKKLNSEGMGRLLVKTPEGELAKKTIFSTHSQKVRSLIKDILNMHDYQSGYKNINVLRQKIGGMIDDASLVGQDVGKLKQLYKTALDVIKSPEGLPPNVRALYDKAYVLASARSTAKHNVFSLESFQKYMNTENFGTFVDDLIRPKGISDDFGNLLLGGSDDVAAIMPKANAQLLEYARSTGRQRLISQALNGDIKGLTQYLDDWFRRDPEGYKLLFGQSDEAFKVIAREVDGLVNSGILDAARSKAPAFSLNKFFGSGANTSQRTTGLEPSTVKKYINGLKPEQLRVMENAIWDDFIDKAFAEMEKGKMMGLGKLMKVEQANNRIAYYRQTGLWDSPAMPPMMKKTMEGLVAYQRLLNKMAPDVGVSLETAQLAAQLKNVFNPFAIVSGMGKMGGNRIVASIMRNRTLAKIIMRGGKLPNYTTDMHDRVFLTVVKGLHDQVKEMMDDEKEAGKILGDMLEKRLITYDEYLKRQGQP